MPRIPIYNSRVSAPGPIPGLGKDLAAPGRALQRLGGAIVGFGEDLARKAAREAAAAEEATRQEKEEEEKREAQAQLDRIEMKITEALPGEPDAPAASGKAEKGKQKGGKRGDAEKRNQAFHIPDSGNGLDPEQFELLKSQAVDDVKGFLDLAREDARFARMRTGALARATAEGDAAGLLERSLADYDTAAGARTMAVKDPATRKRMAALAQDHRAILQARAAQRRNRGMVEVLNRQLEGTLADYAEAVRQDAAMLAAMLNNGADAVAESARLAGLGEERTRDMMRGWIKQAHVALVEGAIERDPALALASLEGGELDAPLAGDAALIERLTRRAGQAADAAEAREKRAAQARRGQFELQKTEYLNDLRETGRGDAAVLTLAAGLLDPGEMAAFRAEEEAAQAHNAARNRYAFMTAKEIEKDIRHPAPRYAEGGKHGKAIRTAVRDEVLAERRKDPAGWAMQDETVADAFAAAEEAATVAESPEAGLAEVEQTDRAFQRALALRMQTQSDMGETPRLLTEAERDALAEELAALSPTERLARIGDLKRRYGGHYEALAQELTGRIAPDTALLLARADDPALAGALASGMALDGVEFRGARVLPLPLAGGRLDKSRLEDRQLYQFTLGDRVVSVVYDRKADALVPALADSSGGESDASGQPGRVRSAIHGAAQDFVGQFARIPEGTAISEGAVYQGVLNVFNQIEAGEKPDLSDISGWAKGMDLFRRYWQGDRAERDALYAQVDGIARGVIGSDLYGAGQWIREQTRQALPTNPEFEDEFQQRLARGGGSFAAFVVGGAAGRVVKIPATLSTAVFGGYSNAAVMFQDAIINGDSWEKAYRKAQLGVIPGLSEALPIARLFGRFDKGAGGSIRRALIEAAKGGTEEALQEGFETFVSNLIKSGAVEFHEEGQLFHGVGENADVSFTLGALANFFAAAAGIRRRPTGPMDAPQHSTAPQSEGPGAELAPEDTGNAPSGRAVAEGVESEAGTDVQVDLDASVAGTPKDATRRAQYYESSLHESFRGEAAAKAEAGQAGHNAFGLIDPASGKPIIQPINDADRMLAMAEENAAPLESQLRELAADLPGVEIGGARVKGPERLAEKLKGGRRPDTLTDYLGGRIVVDDPQMLDEAVRALTSRYRIVEADDFVDNPREFGYRAIHMQVVLDNGMTVEIQIMPSGILPVFEKDHENYERWRNKSHLTAEEFLQKEADEAWAREAYVEAYERWLQR